MLLHAVFCHANGAEQACYAGGTRKCNAVRMKTVVTGQPKNFESKPSQQGGRNILNRNRRNGAAEKFGVKTVVTGRPKNFESKPS